MPRTARGCSKIRRCSLSFFCGLYHASRWGCIPARYPLRKPALASRNSRRDGLLFRRLARLLLTGPAGPLFLFL